MYLEEIRVTRAAPTILIVVLSLGVVVSHDIPQIEIVTGDYERVENVADLPQAVQEFFNAIEVCPGLADRGDDFNSTDVIRAGLPCKRLMAAGYAGNIWFVQYESGGYAHNHFLGLFRVDNDELVRAWTYLDRTPIDVGRLLTHVAEGHVCLVTPPREVYYAEESEACR